MDNSRCSPDRDHHPECRLDLLARLFLMVGTVLFKARDPALQRAVDVVWFVSVAGVAGAVGFAVDDVYDTSAQRTALLVGICTAAYSAVLWLLRKHVPQNVAVFV